MLGGDELDKLNYDDLDAVAHLTRSERYISIMGAVRAATSKIEAGDDAPTAWAGPSEEDPTYK